MSSIRAKVVSGLRWTAVARLSAQLVSWIITIYVVRLLDPADYGLKEMAGVTFFLLLSLSQHAVADAIIQEKEDIEKRIPQLFGLLLLVNAGFALTQIVSAPLVARYFGNLELEKILCVMAASFLILPFNTIPFALLGRKMDFKKRGIVELIGAVASALTVLALALRGFGVWALVFGEITRILVNTVLLAFVHPWLCIPRFSFGGLGSILRVALFLSGSTAIGVIAFRIDSVIGGRIMGAELLGIYAVAMNLAMMPANKMMPLLNQVAFPAYSRLRNEGLDIEDYFLLAVRMISIIVFPAFLGIAATSEMFVPLVFGAKWDVAIEPIMILSLALPIGVISGLYGPLLNATGHANTATSNAMIALLIMTPLYILGASNGLLAFCAVHLIGAPLMFLIAGRRSSSAMNMRFTSVIRECRLPLVSSSIMFGLLKLFIIPILGPVFSLSEFLMVVIIGASIYVILIALWKRSRLAEVKLILFRSEQGKFTK